MSEAAPRAVCYQCHKPQRMCVCAQLSRVDNRTGVFVLQHPRERLHPIGTARFARLGLSKVHVEVAWDAGAREDSAPAWLPDNAALLYPAPNARDLHEVPEAERPENLVVIDGTWHTARTLYRDKTWLQRLPHYRFSPLEPSRYRLRREPHHDYVSTIEAIVEALGVLEPETQGLTDLLRAFDRMIDAQLEHVGRKDGVPRTRKRRPLAERRTPRALLTQFEQLVIVYAESSRPGLAGERSPVHVTAVALGTGAELERVILPPTGKPAALFLAHMRLSDEDFAQACDLAAFIRDWEQFLGACGPKPLLAAWNQGTLDLLAAAIGGSASRMALKSAYRAVHGTQARSLEDAVVKEQLSPVANRFRGRAGPRLANAVAMARYLHARAQVNQVSP